MAEPLASVIVPARDEERNLYRCLAAVRAQRVDFDYEIVVVDSGSTDGTAAVAKGLGARVLSIPRSSFQHGRTRQLASEQARGAFLVYLTADAEPADEHWLGGLVAAVAGDERVAGAYSRQLPRLEADPIEAHRLRHRLSSGTEREIRELGETDFWALSPEERLRLCEFDDVSCCRRRRALNEIPIPAVGWAEDLLWARAALLRGWRIVFEPASTVRHSHPDTIGHAFRRGWLDQDVAGRGFGVVYWKDVASMLRGYPVLFAGQARAIRDARPVGRETAWLLGWNALRLGSEMAGNYLALREPRTEHVAVDLIRELGRGPLRRRYREQVFATSFTLGDDTRPVLFVHPNAAASARVRVPEAARLRFGAGLNPAARGLGAGPVRFIAAVNGEPVWERLLAAGGRDEQPAWAEADIGLERFAGRRVTIAFITRAENTDNAWAGFARPRIVTPKLSVGDRLSNRVIRLAERRVHSEPLRHP